MTILTLVNRHNKQFQGRKAIMQWIDHFNDYEDAHYNSLESILSLYVLRRPLVILINV